MQAIGWQPQRAPSGAPVYYERHRPEQTALYCLVQHHAASFIAHTEARTGADLPQFVTAGTLALDSAVLVSTGGGQHALNMDTSETEQRVRQWLGWESAERAHRSLERRLREAHLGRFKPLADFDWGWPKECDRGAIEELMSLQFLADASSVVLFGPNGVGKTMVAANLGHQAVLQGHTALFTTAGQMLSELAALDSDSALRRRLQHYAAPDLLLIDEVGYGRRGNPKSKPVALRSAVALSTSISRSPARPSGVGQSTSARR